MIVNLLSIDGGGIRGLIPLHILNILNIPFRLREEFNAFAGTSTGAIIAAGLSLAGPDPSKNLGFKYDIDDLIYLYEANAKQIFNQKSYGWLMSKYQKFGIEEVLERYFKGDKLENCKKPLVIPAYDGKNFEPIFFKTRYLNQQGSKYYEALSKWKLTEILRSTAAAPTFFPGFYKDERVLVDGGLFCNNPSLVLLNDVLSHPKFYQIDQNTSDLHINLLSLGTGQGRQNNCALKWGEGKIQYVKPVIDMAMRGNSQSVHIVLEQMVNAEKRQGAGFNFQFNYLRLSPDITNLKFSDMDIIGNDAFDYYLNLVNTYTTKPDIQAQIEKFGKAVTSNPSFVFA